MRASFHVGCGGGDDDGDDLMMMMMMRMMMFVVQDEHSDDVHCYVSLLISNTATDFCRRLRFGNQRRLFVQRRSATTSLLVAHTERQLQQPKP